MRHPVEPDVHCKVISLVKVALNCKVLYGRLADVWIRMQRGLLSDIFQSECPVLVCHFGFLFYLCYH